MSLQGRTSRITLLLAALALSQTLATQVAQAAESGPWSIGADIGASRFKLDPPSGYSVNYPGLSEDKRDTAYSLTAGYRFNPYIAVEAAYMDLGTYRLKYRDPENSSLSGKASADAYGFALSALWQLPINEQWKVFLKTGVLFGKIKGRADVTEEEFTGTEHEHYSRNESGAVPILGLGVSYAITPQWAVRMQYQDIGAANVAKAAGYKLRLSDDIWSLGLNYSF